MISLNEEENNNLVISKENVISFFNSMIGENNKDSEKIKTLNDDLINFCHKKIEESVGELPIIICDINEINTIDLFKHKILWLILLFTLNEPENIYYSFETKVKDSDKHKKAKKNGFIPKYIINDLYKDILKLKENKNNDELFSWLYAFISFVIQKYELRFNHTFVRSLYLYNFDYSKYDVMKDVESTKETICIFLCNLFTNCLFNLNAQNSKLIEKNKKEINAAKESVLSLQDDKIGDYKLYIFLACCLYIFALIICCCDSCNSASNIFMITGIFAIIVLILLILLIIAERSLGKYFGDELITV